VRIIRLTFLAAIAITLITLSLANVQMVTLSLLPASVAEFIGLSLQITLPLFIVILIAIIAGILLGFVWEYMREYKHRAAAATAKRDNDKLAKEVQKLKVEKARDEGDEVLALLDT